MSKLESKPRRKFLRNSALAAAGMAVGVYFYARNRKEQTPQGSAPFAPDAWIRINRDGSVVIVLDRAEMGQGVSTALPMLVAEELDVAWASVKVEQAGANEAYFSSAFPGNQVTGGSASVRAAWQPLREAGAKARAMLIGAAAQSWAVEPDTCTTDQGAVLHAASGRRLSYGELAEAAGKLPVPESVTLKPAKDFRLIGQSLPRLDTPAKVEGTAQFGIDVRLPGMLTAVVARCPVFGGKAAGFDATKAKAVAGVRDVLLIDAGVAVLADNYWAAQRGREVLDVKWDEGAAQDFSTAEMQSSLRRLATVPDAAIARQIGEAQRALDQAATKVEAEYELPFLAHATMEPQNCTAHVQRERCVIWAPTQFQSGDPMFAGGGARGVAMTITGLPREAIEVHTTQLGGGFGRRLESDYVSEAVQLSKLAGVPVKVVWSREDDMQHDVYRPASFHRLSASLIESGDVAAWRHRIVSPSIMSRFIPGWLPDLVTHRLDVKKNGVDEGSVEGANNHAYAIPAQLVDWVQLDTPVPIGFWRSVGYSFNSFVVESFIDELATAAKQDPYQFRRRLLEDAPRHRAVLDLAAEKAGWDTPAPAGRFRGIALAQSFGSCVAEVAEVSVDSGQIKVHRVVCAVDCGQVVNPGIVEAQMQSAIIFGLSAALHGEITVKDGRVEQSNFHDYPVARMNESPAIEVYMQASEAQPTGVGEPGLPPLAPAVANAVFAATGQRLRKMPLRM